MSDKKNIVNIRTAPVVIKYSHITTPDTAFGGSDYKITVIATPELEAQLNAIAEKFKIDSPRFVKEKNGERLVQFKTKFAVDKLKTAPGVEARNPGFAWSGDTVRIAGQAVEYNAPTIGHGMSLRFNGVYLEAVDTSKSKGSGDPFADLEGSTFDAASLDNEAPTNSQSGGTDVTPAADVPAITGDDLPF